MVDYNKNLIYTDIASFFASCHCKIENLKFIYISTNVIYDNISLI